MWKYLLKRFLLMFPTLIGVAVVTFFLIRVIPGDVVELRLAGDTLPPGPRPRPARVADVKIRSFILPGQALEIETAMRSATDGRAELSLRAMVDGKRVATGRVEIVSPVPA